MEEVTEIASHSEESQEHSEAPETAVQDAFEAFGLKAPEKQENALDGEQASDDAPAIEQPSQPKTVKVKHNKEEVEVDISDEKLTDHLQRSLALDKERERKTEYEQHLDRVAKLQGLNDHAELIANLDTLEKQQQQQQENEFETLRTKLIEEYEYAGGDPRNLEAWLDTNPLLTRAKEVLAREEQQRTQAQQEEHERSVRSQWDVLYDKYPHLVEDSNAWERGETPSFFTQEMQDRINRGYDPIDAFELAHRNTLQAQTKKAAEQKAIKDQMLGKRSQVETTGSPEIEPYVPSELSDGFSAFGIDPKRAQKYVKK